MKKATAAVLALTALALGTPALAETRIDRRQANQEERIDQGIQSGALTPAEAARLQRGQAHVDQMEDRALADGRLGPRERARIEAAQDVQSRRIFRQKHDAQHR